MGAYKVHITIVYCVATKKANAIVLYAGAILHQCIADSLPWRGQGLNRALSGFSQAGGEGRLLSGELLNCRDQIGKSLQGVHHTLEQVNQDTKGRLKPFFVSILWL